MVTPDSTPSAECELAKSFQARSSVWLERYLDTVEVNGSSPFGPTISIAYKRQATTLENILSWGNKSFYYKQGWLIIQGYPGTTSV